MKVYIAMRNSDFTEGRGNHVIDQVFELKQSAEDYINSQPGIMGRTMVWTESSMTDWRVVEWDIITGVYDSEVVKKQALLTKTLKKLNDEEIDVLKEFIDTF